MVVPNGSPFERDKDDRRAALVSQRAREIGAPLAYVNMTGGQDDLVFDGDTVIADASGALIARAPQFHRAGSFGLSATFCAARGLAADSTSNVAWLAQKHL